MSSDASIVNLTPPSPFLCFIKLPVFGFRCLSPSFVGPRDRSLIRKLEFFFSFCFFYHLLPPPTRPSLIDPLLKVRFNYITCCSCQATLGYKTLRARAVLTGAITSTESIARHDRALDKDSRTRNWLLKYREWNVVLSDKTLPFLLWYRSLELFREALSYLI